MRSGGSLQILLGTVVLAALGGLAAGCGTTSAQAAGLAAAAANTATSTARIAQTTTMRTHGMSVSLSETGAFDFAHSRGVLHLHGPGPMAFEELFIPPMIYMKVAVGAFGRRASQPGMPGAGFGLLPHGKSWIGVRVGDSARLGAALLGPFGGSANPADLLASLKAESKSVTKLGTAVIRGVQVTHYRVEIDPARAASRAQRRDRAGMSDLAKRLSKATIPADVWVDQSNLVRRLRVSFRPPAG